MILTVTLNPCIDTTIYVRNHRPHQIHRSERVTRIAGGKGVNAARMIRKLGGSVVALVVLGGHAGRHIRDLMANDGIPTVHVPAAGESRHVVTILEVDSENYAQTAYVEPGAPISPDSRLELFQRFDYLLATAQLVLLTGPAPDPMSTDIYAEMIVMARQRGVPVFLDSRGGAFREAVQAVPMLVKPNEAEAAEWLRISTLLEEDRYRALDRLEAMGVRWVVLTLGEEGAWVVCEGERYRAGSPPVPRVNPIASGDAMLGAMAYAWAQGKPPVEVIRMGIAAGAANAAVWDAAGCTRHQVETLVDRVIVQPL